MELELSEEQGLLQSGLRQLLEGACELRRVRRHSYDGDGRDPELWKELAEGGWTASGVPETLDGGGLGFEEAAIVALESGRSLLHQPLIETLLAARALQRAGCEAPLSEIAHDGASATLAVLELSRDFAPDPELPRARSTQAGWELSGEHFGVPFGPLAQRCLVEAELESGEAGLLWVSTDQTGVGWREVGAMDRTVRRYALTLEAVEVPGECGAGAGDALGELPDEWRVLLAAQTQGACARLLEMTVDYAKKREQFGRPIGANQAVKVRLALAAAAVERMLAAVYHAALKIEQGASDRGRAAAMAKLETASPGAEVATQGIHVHGALGYTWEQDVQLFAKRIKTNEILLGSDADCLERVARTIL